MDKINEKTNAAEAALAYLKEGTVIGLGSGTTSAEFIRLLGEKVRAGFRLEACISTSFDSRANAIKFGLSQYLCDPDQVEKIDIAIDGADLVVVGENSQNPKPDQKVARSFSSFDSKRRNEIQYILKGGGAALTREKIVAYNAKEFIVIVDSSKVMKPDKTSIANVALECIKFSAPFVLRTLNKLGYGAIVRTGCGKVGPIISDNNNFIIDAKIEIKNAENLEAMLNSIPGVLENGIFTKFDKIIVGMKNSTYQICPRTKIVK